MMPTKNIAKIIPNFFSIDFFLVYEKKLMLKNGLNFILL
jgi:hypothetical protein